MVAVLDEQDTPPVFTIAPPTTILDSNLKPGDLILQVHAEDGDKGNPRDIRYDLVPDQDTPFTEFFNISENTGTLNISFLIMKSCFSNFYFYSHSLCFYSKL